MLFFKVVGRIVSRSLCCESCSRNAVIGDFMQSGVFCSNGIEFRRTSWSLYVCYNFTHNTDWVSIIPFSTSAGSKSSQILKNADKCGPCVGHICYHPSLFLRLFLTSVLVLKHNSWISIIWNLSGRKRENETSFYLQKHGEDFVEPSFTPSLRQLRFIHQGLLCQVY